MKKFLRWFSKHINEILVFLLIIVIGLYIIFFADSISDKAEKILTALAATASTFFLFLAFQESRKSNILKIYESQFQLLETKIVEQEKKATQPVYNLTYIREIGSIISYPEIRLLEISYSKFYLEYASLFTHIENNDVYKKTILKLGSNNSIMLPNDEFYALVEALSKAIHRIHSGIISIFVNYAGLFVLYHSIHSSSLLVEQKKLLFTRLDVIIKEYDILVESFVNNETFGIYIKNFKMFNVFLGELKKSESAFDSKFFEIYNFIQDIRTEYKH